MAVLESSSMTEAPINPAMALLQGLTSRNEIVDFAILSKYLLYSDSASDEEAQDEAKQAGRIGRLGLVEVEQVSDDLARSADVPDMSEHSESQSDQEASASRFDQLLHELDHELGVRVVVGVGRVQHAP